MYTSGSSVASTYTQDGKLVGRNALRVGNMAKCGGHDFTFESHRMPVSGCDLRGCVGKTADSLEKQKGRRSLPYMAFGTHRMPISDHDLLDYVGTAVDA